MVNKRRNENKNDKKTPTQQKNGVEDLSSRLNQNSDDEQQGLVHAIEEAVGKRKKRKKILMS